MLSQEEILRYRAMARVRKVGVSPAMAEDTLGEYLQEGNLRLLELSQYCPTAHRERMVDWLTCQLSSRHLFCAISRSDCVESIPFAERQYAIDNLPLWVIAYLTLQCQGGIDFSGMSRTIRRNRSLAEIALLNDMRECQAVRGFLGESKPRAHWKPRVKTSFPSRWNVAQSDTILVATKPRLGGIYSGIPDTPKQCRLAGKVTSNGKPDWKYSGPLPILNFGPITSFVPSKREN